MDRSLPATIGREAFSFSRDKDDGFGGALVRAQDPNSHHHNSDCRNRKLDWGPRYFAEFLEFRRPLRRRSKLRGRRKTSPAYDYCQLLTCQ